MHFFWLSNTPLEKYYAQYGYKIISTKCEQLYNQDNHNSDQRRQQERQGL